MVASQSLAQMVLLLCPLSAQAQTGPQSVDGKLDASDTEVAASLASSSQRELVIGRGPYFYWNEVPTPAPPDGSDTYTAVVGDVITFRYNHDNNVYLMATEADWESCDFGSATLVGDQIMDNAPQDFSSVGLTNVYRAVLEQPGTLYFSCHRDRFSSCDHCAFGQKIKVSVSGAGERPPPSPPPAPCDLLDNCECSCCDADACPGFPASQRVYVQLKFNAESAESCNAAACSSRFARCTASAPRRLYRPQGARSRSGSGSTHECMPRPVRGPGRTRECTLAHTPRQGRG